MLPGSASGVSTIQAYNRTDFSYDSLNFESLDTRFWIDGFGEVMRISASGDVGIGTSSPWSASKLNVVAAPTGAWAVKAEAGTAATYLADGDGYGAYIDGGASASSSTYLLNVNKSGVSALYVRGDGTVGIGTTTPSYALQVSGDISVSGNFKINGTNLNSGTVTSV